MESPRSGFIGWVVMSWIRAETLLHAKAQGDVLLSTGMA